MPATPVAASAPPLALAPLPTAPAGPSAPVTHASPATPHHAATTAAAANTPATSAAATTAAAAAQAAAAASAALPTPAMDRDFIARNQIVERYLSGRLPLKGATDFEKFCTDNPGVLDELGLPERVNAGLRLLEAAGKPEPWQEAPKSFWQKPHLAIGLAVATLALTIGLIAMLSDSSTKSARIAKLEKIATEQPLEPASTTQTIRLLPNYKGSTNTPAVVLGGVGRSQLADLKIDLSRSAYRSYKVTIDRVDQGRVAILHNLSKDSNGHLRIALNTTALGPGNYTMTLEGLTWKGETVPEAWLTIGIVH
jgi:hypothetical protein